MLSMLSGHLGITEGMERLSHPGPIAMVFGIVLVIVKGVGRMIHSELKALKERYDSVSASNADK